MADDRFTHSVSYTVRKVAVSTEGVDFSLNPATSLANESDLVLEIAGEEMNLRGATKSFDSGVIIYSWFPDELPSTHGFHYNDTDGSDYQTYLPLRGMVSVCLRTSTQSCPVGTIVRPDEPTDAALSRLALRNASDDIPLALNETFSPTATTYTAVAANPLASMTVEAAPRNANAEVAYLSASGVELTDADTNKTGFQVDLAEGENVIQVKVTAADGSTALTYSVTVTREASGGDAVWSTTMTVEEHTDGQRGYSGGEFGSLETASFTIGRVNFDVFALGIESIVGALHLWLSERLSSHAAYTLEFAGETLPLADADVSSDGDGETFVFSPAWLATHAPSLSVANVPTTLATGKRVPVCLRNATQVCPEGTATSNTPATGKPSITGVPQVGENLTAAIGTIADTDGPPGTFPDDYGFQWVLVDGGTETDIAGETSSTYTPATADVGKTIKVKVSFTDGAGIQEGPLTSDATAAVTAACAEVWCATLTVQSISGGHRGCANSQSGEACSNTSHLTEDEFPHGGTGYAVTSVQVRSDGELRLFVNPDLTTATQSLVLLVGSERFAFAHADTKAANARYWNSSGLSWPALSTVDLKLVEASTIATLSDLELDDGDGTAVALSPEFSSATTSYTASVANSVSRITLTETPSDANAWVDYLDGDGTALTDLDTGKNGHQADLDPGDNVIQMKVTAEDGVATRTYEVTVTSEAAQPVPVSIVANHDRIGAGIEGLVFTLTRDGATTDALEATVTIVQDKEWLDSADLSHTVTFLADSAGATLRLGLAKFSFEPSVSGNLTATVAVAGISGASATVEMISTAHPPITISYDKSSYIFAEDAADVNIYLVATLDPVYPRAPSPGFGIRAGSAAGTAVFPGDYRPIGGVVSFTSGNYEPDGDKFVARKLFQDSSDIFTVVNDDVYEGSERFDVSINRHATQTPPGLVRLAYSDGTTCDPSIGCSPVPSYEVTITDEEDLPVLTLATDATSITHDDGTTPEREDVAILTVSAASPKTFATEQTITLTFAGTAANGTHYSVSPADMDENASGHQVILPAETASVEITVTAQTIIGADRTIDLTASRDGAAFGTATIAVNGSDATNTAPTAVDSSITIDEDTAHAFAAADFNFADTDPGAALASVTVVTLPAAGALTLGGTAVTAGHAVAAADIGTLVFTPAANANGPGYANFTFKVSDGTDESASAYIMTVNVTAVNDPATGAPTIGGTARVGGSLTAATADIADLDGLAGATYGYQWVRVDADGMSNATDITSETSVTYVPVAADVGKKVRVKVSFTDDGGGNEELTSDAYPSSGTIEAEAPGICGRTRQVRGRILAKITGVNDCALVTDARLANITGTLELDGRSIDTLAAGDFAGLTALTTLNLGSNDLTTLPDDVFEPLTALTGLYLNSNELRTLDAGVFAGLPLQDLRLSSNRLTTLPAGVFAGLTELQELTLGTNKLNTLDAGVFAGLTALETLRLAGNKLTTLDAGVFAGLTALETLRLESNDLVTLDAGVFAGLSALDDAGSGLQRPDHVARRRVRAADRADGSAVVGQSRGALRAGGGCPTR